MIGCIIFSNSVYKQQTLKLPHFGAALCVCVHMCLYLHGHRYVLSSWLLLSFRTRPYLVWWRCTVHLMLCGYSLLDSSNNPQSGPALWKSRLPCHRFTGWEVGQGLRVYAITHIRILKYLTLAYGRCIFSSSHFTEGLCNIKTISFFFPSPLNLEWWEN